MELTGKLKEQVEQAETREEAKKVIEDAGMRLSDDELDVVSGGWGGLSHQLIWGRDHKQSGATWPSECE